LVGWNPSAVGCAGVFPRKEDLLLTKQYHPYLVIHEQMKRSSWMTEVKIAPLQLTSSKFGEEERGKSPLESFIIAFYNLAAKILLIY